MNTQIGNKIRNLRRNKGWSQEQTADYLHISQSAFARIENGESNAWATIIEPLCKLFEIEPTELLKQEPILINNNQQGGNFSNSMIINNLSEKITDLYAKRLNQLEKENNDLKKENKVIMQIFVEKLEILISKMGN